MLLRQKDKHCNFESDWPIYTGLKDFSLYIILKKKKKHFPIISNNLPNLDKNKMNFNLKQSFSSTFIKTEFKSYTTQGNKKFN